MEGICNFIETGAKRHWCAAAKARPWMVGPGDPKPETSRHGGHLQLRRNRCKAPLARGRERPAMDGRAGRSEA